jgi:acetyl esterase/lipase
MTTPWLFLLVTLVGAAFTLSALARGRTFGLLVVPYFFGAWLTGELAIHHLAWQAVATILFVYAGALGAWPGWLGLLVTLLSWWGLIVLQRRAALAPVVLEAALRAGLGDAYRDTITPELLGDLGHRVTARRLVRPFRMRDRRVQILRNLQYGDGHRRTRLDVYRPVVRPARCPVLLQIHGGGWVIGQKHQQGQPLMHRLASRGWICVAPNYRLSPRVTFPDHLIDVKRALAWIRLHGEELGADPDFVIVTGGSAGGHLASLVGLTANDPEYQPGFEHVDTAVAACVPFYGVYDFLDRRGIRGRASMTPFLERVVMKCSPVEHPERWDKASPVMRVHDAAPPFFVIHGTHDSLAFVEDAREFVARLRAVSRAPVLYAELPGAQHAFEVFHSWRSAHTIDAVCWFAEHVHGAYRLTHAAAPARQKEALGSSAN